MSRLRSFLEFKFNSLLVRLLSIVLPLKVMARNSYFSLWERRGYHLVPIVYDAALPDTRTLADELWVKPLPIVGIDFHDDAQLDLLRQFKTYQAEYSAFPQERTADPQQFYLNQPNFPLVDAMTSYAMLRHVKPQRMIEIGAGFSTLLAAKALRQNRSEGFPCEFTSIDAYPNSILPPKLDGLDEFIAKPVQEIPLEVFSRLQANDILFIDSSHMLKIGSDVHYEFLHILPRLNNGVYVHVHDIFLPDEMPKKWVMEQHRFWNEQYILQAFLSFNTCFQVIWAGNYMRLTHPGAVQETISAFKPSRDVPGSFWIQRVC